MVMGSFVGQQLGNYRIEKLLGSGGFADVYLGKHVYLDNLAAIKVLQTRLSQEDLEQFRDEARNLVRLIHPNIVRLLDFGFEGNIPYLVMDYAPNGSLRDKYPKGTRLPLSTIVPYVKQIAEALQYAHDRKLIHRDVKPENMLLGHNGEVLLSDFGIAVTAHSTGSSFIEAATGTVSYIAPEQIQGKPRPSSDQYALGITVYFWLTGTLPFTGTYTEVALQHLTQSPPPMRTIIPDIPDVIEHVVLRALEKDYQYRYSSVYEFAGAVEQVAHVQSTPTVRVSMSQQNTPQRTEFVMPSAYYKTKEQWFSEGCKYSEAGQYIDAIVAYENTINLDPGNALAYNNRGYAYFQLQNYVKALEDYNQAIFLNPGFVMTFTNRGRVYSALRKYREAIKDYNHVIALSPQHADAYTDRGYVYWKLHGYQEAIRDYSQAILINPKHTKAYFNRGLIYYELQKYRKAIEDYSHALATDSRYAMAYNNRGNAYYQLKEYRKAIEDYERALAINPELTLIKDNHNKVYRLLNGR